jgi:hypothetical protein
MRPMRQDLDGVERSAMVEETMGSEAVEKSGVEVVGDDEEDDGEVDDVLNSEEDEDAPVSFAVGGGDDWD